MSIFVFHGADHKCGTSMIAQSVAEKLAADNPEKMVLLIHTESNKGNDYCPYLQESMENIRPYMAGKFIDAAELIEKSRVRDNLSIIGGPNNPENCWDYHPDMTEFLLHSVKKHYDYILCDSGSDFEHGLALGSLLAGDRRYLVLRQTEVALSRFEWLRAVYEKLDIGFDMFVLNMYSRSGVYDKAYIRERLNLPDDRVLTVKESPYGTRAEMDRRTILQYPGNSFGKDIGRILDDITMFNSRA